MITLQYQVPSISYKQAKPPSSKSNASMSPSNSNPSSRRFDPEPTYSKQSQLAICFLNHGKNRPLKSSYDSPCRFRGFRWIVDQALNTRGDRSASSCRAIAPARFQVRASPETISAGSEIVPDSIRLRGLPGALQVGRDDLRQRHHLQVLAAPAFARLTRPTSESGKSRNPSERLSASSTV